MSLYIGQGSSESRISRKNFFNRSSLTSLDVAWSKIQPLLGDSSLEDAAKIVLYQWRGDQTRHWYLNWDDLAGALKVYAADILGTGQRPNYFYQQEGENLNSDPVIFSSKVPTSSVGWKETEFFEELGHPCNPRWETRWVAERYSSRKLAEWISLAKQNGDQRIANRAERALRRRAEQEYLLMNMVKGAMFDAAEVADEYDVGIAVRGTGMSAHMAIESGDPTKGQEFKNKTSKEIDLILCEEMDWSQIGSVVHYDPRIEWKSQAAEIQVGYGKCPMFKRPANDADWEKKKPMIGPRIKALNLRRPKAKPMKEPSEKDLKEAFLSRSKEYMEEDHEYRKGGYAIHTTLVGPYIRVKLRPGVNMVGDHYLFAFTCGAKDKPSYLLGQEDNYGFFLPDTDARVAMAQKALQNKETFQAQHGGIWYWKPTKEFNMGIKAKIMGNHTPEKGEDPLVYIRPSKEVTAAFYLPEEDRLVSVWAFSSRSSSASKWMRKTHSGQCLWGEVPPPDFAE